MHLPLVVWPHVTGAVRESQSPVVENASAAFAVVGEEHSKCDTSGAQVVPTPWKGGIFCFQRGIISCTRTYKTATRLHFVILKYSKNIWVFNDAIWWKVESNIVLFAFISKSITTFAIVVTAFTGKGKIYSTNLSWPYLLHLLSATQVGRVKN